jgi:tetratricopeptide (TPR) repeat protein
VRRRERACVVLVLVAAALTGCAPAFAPPPTGATARYPDFVFPAPPPALAHSEATGRLEQGWRLLEAGDVRRARREFSSALQASAYFYPAEAGLGYASLAEKNYPDAVAHFSRALDRDARYVPALVGRGDALVGMSRLDDAMTDLQAAVTANPSLTDVRRRMEVVAFRREQQTLQAARAAAGAGRFDEAAAAYKRAIARSPDSALLYRELAGVERSQGKTDEAIAHLRQAITIDPTDARALMQLGELFEARGDFAAAADAYARANQIEPGEQIGARLAAARAQSRDTRLPEQYDAIAKATAITRGDLAALVGVRLGALIDSAPHRDGVVVTDVRGSWAAAWILAVVRAGVMDPYPNHAFAPKGPVVRLELARVASRVLDLIEARRPRLAQDWRAARPRIADLPPGHLGYPAAALVVGAGVMPLVDGNRFHPERPVAGSEAIDVVTRLEGLAR